MSKVRVINQLEHNKLLKIRCDDNEWDSVVRIGDEYEYTFNFFKRILFLCKLSQGPNNFEHHQEFMAYNVFWSKATDSIYNWIAKEDGIYYSQDGSTPMLSYYWDSPNLLKN
ncbi:Plant self-incompatibility protein S1 family [Raphanus sativus]|nr:Plant self-incompatibility protein S1 family [Raphanus sativus]